MTTKPLKVGFDLDGVLLYNPARILRLPITLFKRIFIKKRQKKFLVPSSPFSKFIWKTLHWSSLFIAPGFEEIEKLAKKGAIEAYIISARYNFLQDDFHHWIKKLNKNSPFTGIHFNEKNEQPHLFKEKMLHKLGLDVFVEDNYDIVSHLNGKTQTKIFWIYNFLDRAIDHSYKFANLSKAVEQIKKML